MNFNELSRARCSVRSFDTEKTVSKELLNRLAETASFAPSAANRQPWRFVFAVTQESLEELHAAYPRDWFATAPVVLAIVGSRNQAWVRQSDGFSSLATDMAIVMDHFLLAAADAGLGSCWIAAFQPELVGKIFKLDDNEEIQGIAALGYPAIEPARKKERKAISELVSWL